MEDDPLEACIRSHREPGVEQANKSLTRFDYRSAGIRLKRGTIYGEEPCHSVAAGSDIPGC